MATRGTGKTYEEILKEEMESGKSKYNETEAKVRGDAEQSINNQNAIIDKSAQATTSQYQKSIDEAPSRFAGAYDANYIDELVARKNLENTMADLGLTDSGLNRSQQTAVSVMRGNADAKTRAQQNDYVTGLKNSIDQVLAQAEADKASYANQVNSSADSHLSQLWSAMEQNANSTAASRYKAQEESLDAIYKAELEAETEAEKQRLEAIEKERDYAVKMLNAGYVQQQDGSWVKDNTAEQTTFATKLIAEGYSPEDSVLMAKLYYDTASEQDKIMYAGKQAGYTGDQLTAYVNAGGGDAGVEAAYNVSAKEARNVVSSIQVKVNRGLKSSAKLGEEISRVAGEKLSARNEYMSLGQLGQNFALSYAIAMGVANSCSGMTEQKVSEVLRAACASTPNADYESAKAYLDLIYKPENVQAKALVTRR